MAKKMNFINPYNFIPVSASAVSSTNASAEKDDTGNLRGVIEYSLLTKTPLFIPNTSNDHAIKPDAAFDGIDDEGNPIVKDDYHKSYEFFAYEDLTNLKQRKTEDELLAPVIPGSEIRGMFRSNFEILTNSCFSAIDDDIVLSKRNSEVFKAALIYRTAQGKFSLVEGIDYLLRTGGADNLIPDLHWKDDNAHNSRRCFVQSTLSEGQKVYVMKDPHRKTASYIKPVVATISTSGTGGTEGYVLKGEAGPDMVDSYGNTQKNQKHCCHIIASKKEGFFIKNLDISVLDKVLRIYKDNGEHPYTEYSKAWETFKKGQGNDYFPVYYSKIDKYYMLSPAAITHEVYRTKLSDMIASHKTCNDKRCLCPACRLFGTIQKDAKGKNFSVASRIRFSDLYADQNKKATDLYDKPIMLKELSSPKPSNVEFYLKRPENALFWTYDYYIDQNGRTVPYTAEISGRKFYWHHPGIRRAQIQAEEQTIRNITVRPVRSNTLFKGKVFFDGISETELNQLLYLINTGDFSVNDGKIEEKRYGYKLGGAKPLGFGSVAIQIDQVKLRTIRADKANRTVIQNCSDHAPAYTTPVFDPNIVSNFTKMVSFDSIAEFTGKDYVISYPVPEKPDDKGVYNIYDWFTSNHTGYDHKNHKPVGMPNQRSQMVNKEYMQPMNPVLVSTGFGGSRNTLSEDTRKKRGPRNTYEIGKTYEGTVDERKPNGKYVWVKLQGGGKASVWDGRKTTTKGDTVTLLYEGDKLGNDGRMYPNWKLISKN